MRCDNPLQQYRPGDKWLESSLVQNNMKDFVRQLEHKPLICSFISKDKYCVRLF